LLYLKTNFMQTTANEKKVIEFLKKTPNANKADITAATTVSGLPLFNFLRRLEKAEYMTIQGTGADVTINWNEEQPQIQAEGVVENVVAAEKPKVVKKKNAAPVDEVTATATSRDNTTYQFMGETYGKGKLILAVVTQYIKDNPTVTYAKLKTDIFPDTLLKRFGIVQLESKAREISGKRDRYFLKETQLIKIKGQKEGLAVCNQITSKNIVPFLDACRKLGLKIK